MCEGDKFTLYINSSQRSSGTNAKPTFRASNTFSASKWRCRSANIPYTWYTFNQVSITFSYEFSSVTYHGIIQQGTYTMNELLTELKSKLDASGSGLTFTLTYNSFTNRISISAGSAFSILETPLSLKLGFGNTGSAVSHTALSPPNLTGPTTLGLRCSELSTWLNQNVSGSQTSANYDGVILYIPNNKNYTDIITYDGSNDRFENFMKSGVLTTLNFQLVDLDTGRVLDPILPWDITLEFIA